MKVSFDTRKPNPGFFMLNGKVVPFRKLENTDGLDEVCTLDGKNWHSIEWFWERMNPVIKDKVNTGETISAQDQLNMCITLSECINVPLLIRED